jgi:hypothetical protein
MNRPAFDDLNRRAARYIEQRRRAVLLLSKPQPEWARRVCYANKNNAEAMLHMLSLDFIRTYSLRNV